MAFPKKKRAATMTGESYRIIAGIILAIKDPVLRQQMADHFGTEFNKRSARFDPYAWGRMTGGKVAPNSAAK